MLSRELLHEELTGKGPAFELLLREHHAAVGRYLSALTSLERADGLALTDLLGGFEHPGAVPAAELHTNRSFRFAFERRWRNHEEARGWAAEVLSGRTTFAADGSQIYTGKETLLPVAAVQIGWFENPHDAGRPYEKQNRFEILTPDELLKDLEEPMNPDIRVELRRYLGEAERVGEFLKKKQGWEQRGEPMPVAFFDNPLLVPFSQKGLQKNFLEATVSLVRLSETTRVPLVGYVDRSFSRDIVTMLGHIGGITGDAPAVYDASVLRASAVNGSRVLENWGDRTCFCYSKRRGLSAFEDAGGRSAVGFAYLQTTADSAPARLDMPSWIYEAGRLEEVVDVVRAECIVGLGYPYPLETADAAAVIPPRDREVFFRALQDFAERGKLDFSVTRKDASKSRRR